MPQLDLETIETIADGVAENLKFPFDYANRKWVLTSKALRAQIKADITAKLQSIPFSQAEIAWINSNKDKVIGEIKFTRRITSNSYASDDLRGFLNEDLEEKVEGNVYTGDKVIRDGLTKLYYEALDHKTLQYVSMYLFQSGDNSEVVATYDKCRRVIDIKELHKSIFKLYINQCDLKTLGMEMTALHDEREPRTQFIRRVQGFFRSYIDTYADTSTWSEEVTAIREKAKASTDGTEEGKSLSFTIAHCIYPMIYAKANDAATSSTSSLGLK